MAAGAAFDDFLRETAPASRNRRPWAPGDGPMPALYLSHGAPPLFDDRGWIEQLCAWAQALPRPSAILIVSGHRGISPPEPVGQRRGLHTLFVTLGAATDIEHPVQTTVEGYFLGLSKRSFQAA